jgi:site-specific recombinase XerD
VLTNSEIPRLLIEGLLPSALDVRDFFVQEAAFRVQGKGGRDLLAFIINVETVNIQRAYLEARRSIKTESPALFINASGQRLSTQGMTNVIARRGHRPGPLRKNFSKVGCGATAITRCH